MSISIFEEIQSNVHNGMLLKSFTLGSTDTKEEGIKWAPGALDGVMKYHMGREPMKKEAVELMQQALGSIAEGNLDAAEYQFGQLVQYHRAIVMIDEIQSYILDHSSEYDVDDIFDMGERLVTKSTDIECVKIGLELLEILQIEDEDVKNAVRIIGQYDEFTLFAVWTMQSWENGNHEIFQLAQKVHSWGRIHAVEAIEPENEEIKRWLLSEGIQNDVMEAYSALEVWNKSDANKYLAGNPTEEEFHCIARIIDGLLDEGPVQGISAVDDYNDVLVRFLSITQNYNLLLDDYMIVRAIRIWAEDEEAAHPEIVELCHRIIGSEDCKKTVEQAVELGDGIKLAIELNIPFKEALMKRMESHFEDVYYQCGYLMDDPKYENRTLDLFREKISFEDIAGTPTNKMGFGDDYKKHGQLEFLLQELTDTPFRGVDFVIMALHGSYIRDRNRALHIIQRWVEIKETPLCQLSKELFEEVYELNVKEVADGPKDAITSLLSGAISFDKPEDTDAEGGT